MKTFIATLVLLSLNMSLYAQAKISFVNSTIEFNNIKRGNDSTQTYTFKNTGNKALLIKKAVSTSRHLTISKPGQKIDPGKTGKIKVVFQAKTKGPIRRTITVYSNAKNKPVTALKVKGKVID